MLKEINALGLACPQPVILAKKEWQANQQPFAILVDNLVAVKNLQKLAQSLGVEVKIQAQAAVSATAQVGERYQVEFWQGNSVASATANVAPNAAAATVANVAPTQAKSSSSPKSAASPLDATQTAPIHPTTNGEPPLTIEQVTVTDLPSMTSPLPAPLKPFTLFVGKNYIGEGDPELGQQLITMYFYTLIQSESVPHTIAFMNRGVFLPTTNEQVIEHLRTLQEKGCQILVCGACLNFYQLADKLQVGEVSNMYAIWEKLAEHHSIVTL